MNVKHPPFNAFWDVCPRYILSASINVAEPYSNPLSDMLHTVAMINVFMAYHDQMHPI